MVARQDVVRPARRLELAALTYASRAKLCQERVARELDAERRLVAVTRVDDGLGREPLGEHPDRREQGVPVGAGQVDAADRAGEEQVAAEELALGVERDVRGRVAGHREAFEGDARYLDRLAAADEVLGRVRASRDADRRELRVALEPLALALRHPDLRAGSLGEVGDAAEMVEVPVRDQDPDARGAEPRELEPQVGRVAAGIDDRALGRAALAPDDVAVRLQRAELVSVDRERHRGESSGSVVSAGGCGKVVRAPLEAPRGRDAARHAVARRLAFEGGRRAGRPHRAPPGEALGDHGVKESALLLVLDGAVRVEAGDESVEADAGRCFTSIPTSGARSRAAAAHGSCCFSPLARRGHYRGDPAERSGVSAS